MPLPGVPPAALFISAGPLTGTRVPLNGVPVTIGASAQCTITLPSTDKDVEDRHARVWSRDGRYMLHRLARERALEVAGRRVQWAVLEAGDEFAVGPHAFRFELEAADVELA
jgi:predicted component of type VI protein secretion system